MAMIVGADAASIGGRPLLQLELLRHGLEMSPVSATRDASRSPICAAAPSGSRGRSSTPVAERGNFGARDGAQRKSRRPAPSQPARARVAAMPGPMVPRPMTAAFVMSCPVTCFQSPLERRFDGVASSRRLLEGRPLRRSFPPGPKPGSPAARSGNRGSAERWARGRYRPA